jgi:hypothetical protein
MADDPYAILEVKRGASDSEIKAAYRRLAAKYHPDRNPGFQDAANEKLKTLNDAYDRIKATGSRSQTDRAPSAEASSNTAEQEARRDGRDRQRASASDDEPTSAPGTGGRASAEDDHLAAIAAALARVGFLQSAEHGSPTVEVVASIVRGGADIVVCVPYNAVMTSGPYSFTEIHRSFLRAVPSAATPFLAAARPAASTMILLCTEDALLWTTSHIAAADSVLAEEHVTAQWLAFADVLGCRVTSRRKGTLEIWIDDGPTLTFRVGPRDAETLSAYVESAAASQ